MRESLYGTVVLNCPELVLAFSDLLNRLRSLPFSQLTDMKWVRGTPCVPPAHKCMIYVSNIFVPVYGLVGETCRCFVAGKRAIFVRNDYKPNDKAKKGPSAC